ncbi:LysE family translocator [Gluconobacter kanchanaburiensis]|uniref:Lysine transporter LysE n=1 Tax=Gluconobacter kanchanaburiensis NBRC 103587 TaxID=1307948 RepID=A0A511B924_9PROT|nr:LysE family translocator [Gluconobacter kanchanaburiensis]MBF0862683.1 LysE family translocator [Gluconobacter kanchanaburiensis]GBR67494.1 amino acid efflux protein [Gluconobacter kanchanaburiensis NBRC 103587]GEK96945.1 lysine transporter LysE [Gluconobacter kanchanaburiensis NBRC 103587]
MHPYLIPLLTFAAAAAVFTITPGLDTAMTLRTATTSGWKAGLAAVVGICLGLGIWGLAAAFGLTALLAASETAFTVVKWAGALYLAWLGIGLILRPRTSLGAAEAVPVQADARAAFSRGLLTNLLNPKVGIFYMTFMPQFIPPHVNVKEFSLLLTAIQALLSFSWLALLVVLTVPLGRFLSSATVVRRMDRLTGSIFLAFSLKLALSRRA